MTKQQEYNRDCYLRKKQDPKWVARRKLQARKWRKANKDKVAAYSAEYRKAYAGTPEYKDRRKQQYQLNMLVPAFKDRLYKRHKAWQNTPAGKASMLRLHNSPRRRYNVYRVGAVRRGIPFKLSFKQFMSLWQQPCTYCGSPIDTVGLDREVNSKGYTVRNVVPCCHTCNIAKSIHSKDAYIAHCKRVVEFSHAPAT